MGPDEAFTALEQLSSGTPPPSTDVINGLVTCVAARWPADFPTAAQGERDLVAVPCVRPARDWHLECLRHALDAACRGSDPRSAAARIRYHARWLTHLFDANPATLPKVSIVIPIYNRAWLAADVVRSCLAQSYGNLEIVVVDDGSTDDPESALGPFQDRIRIVRQANGGVSAARNAGVAAATGEFIQFLDSDDLLHPDSTALKMQAFAAVPDAELCTCASLDVSLYEASADFGLGPGYGDFLPLGEATGATRDLLAAVGRGLPFYVPSALVPRWVLFDAGLFDADLRRHEDVRLVVRLGLRGTKAIGLRRRLFYRCRMGDGLSEPSRPIPESIALAWVRCLVDLLARPTLWPLAAHFVTSPWVARSWDILDDDPAPALDPCRKQLLDAVGSLRGAGGAAGLSPLALLVFLWLRLEHSRTRRPVAGQASHGFHASLERALVAAIEAAPPSSARDEEMWRHHCSAPVVDDEVRAVLTHRRSPPCAPRHKAKVRATLWLMRDAAGRPDPARASLRRRVRHAARRVASLRSVVHGRKRQPPPKVTLVVPVLGDAESVEATVRSCLDQTYPEVEVLILDGDAARLRRWSRQFRDIRCVRLVDPEGGEPFARNVGTREATGLLVRFLEPGYGLAPDAIRDQVRALCRTGGCGIALVGSYPDVAGAPNRATVRPLVDLLAEGQEPPLSAMLVPRWVIDKIGGFDVVLGAAHEQRYRVRLAAAGVPCAMLHAPSTHRSHASARGPGGASTTMLATLANVAQALRVPRLWPCLPVVGRPLVEPWTPATDELARDGLLTRQWRHLFRVVGSLGAGSRLEGRSPLPAFALCLGGIVPDVPGEPPELAELRIHLLDAAATAAPIEPDWDARLGAQMRSGGLLNTALSRARTFLAPRRPDSPLTAVLGGLSV